MVETVVFCFYTLVDFAVLCLYCFSRRFVAQIAVTRHKVLIFVGLLVGYGFYILNLVRLAVVYAQFCSNSRYARALAAKPDVSCRDDWDVAECGNQQGCTAKYYGKPLAANGNQYHRTNHHHHTCQSHVNAALGERILHYAVSQSGPEQHQQGQRYVAEPRIIPIAETVGNHTVDEHSHECHNVECRNHCCQAAKWQLPCSHNLQHIGI